MKYITIATDVSCDPRHKISTWACYIRHSGGVIKQVAEFKDYHRCAPKAETYALINALIIAKDNIPDWSDSKIIIYNEIEYVLTPTKNKSGVIRQGDEHRTAAIESIAIPILKQAKDWERRKVKAHYKDWEKSGTRARYILNQWCDEESRKKLKLIRKEMKNR